MIPLRRPTLTHLLLASFLTLALSLVACQGSSEPTATSPTPAATSSPAPTTQASPTPAITSSPAPTTQPSPASTVQPSATPETTPGGSASVVSGERAYAHVVELAQRIGSRTAGSDAEQAAADYIADQFTSYGYQPTLEPFEVKYYVEQASRLEVLSPEATTLEPRALSLSAAGEATGDLAAAGIGRPGDFPTEGMTGRVALLERGELTFSDKVANAAAAGVAAVIVYNNQPGSFRGDLGDESAIPAVGISQEEGQRLLGLLAQGPVTVRLSVEAGFEQGTSQNVIARPPDGRCEEVVGAHYDSVEAGPGANDNASGVAALLETARVLAAGGDREGVCLVAFGAEEVGLVGSQRFVANLDPDERQVLRGMVNLDMVGVGDQWQLIGSPELAQEVDAQASSLGLDPVATELPAGLGADQSNFIGAGIPAVLIHRFDDPRYHSAEDQVQFVEPRLLQEATELTLLALRVLEAP